MITDFENDFPVQRDKILPVTRPNRDQKDQRLQLEFMFTLFDYNFGSMTKMTSAQQL